jgi:serine/threonine-protein kinase
MYFLQNRRTRDVINAAFITALVPLAQLASISNILDHTSMEESRWVVLDSNLKPLEHAVIYANAQEGERIVSDLAKRYRGG